MSSLRMWVLALSTLFACQGHAFTEQDPSYSSYYTIEEQNAARSPRPMDLGSSQLAGNYFTLETMALQTQQLAVSLLKWARHDTPANPPVAKFERVLLFGRWINDPTDDTCYNTRSKVLIRDSNAPVSFREQNHCVVDRGNWNEPYTGQQMMYSNQIQIDHMVPLKNAYLSGAWQWDFHTRCLYANFMGNKFHLISASGTENMRKGDRSPDKYLPPLGAYRCQYLENWLKIKLIWRLRMTEPEVAAIQSEIQQNHCNPQNFVMTANQLKYQRAIIYSHTELCPERH